MMWVQSLRDCVAPGDGGQTHEKISDNGNDQGLVGGAQTAGGLGTGSCESPEEECGKGFVLSLEDPG